MDIQSTMYSAREEQCAAPATETYEPPRVERLGSLAELTLGGHSGPDDGFGGAGDEGSV